MAKKSKDVYGADGQSNLLNFDPTKLVLVTDTTSPLYAPRVHLLVDEALARNIDYQGVLEPIAASKNPETGETEVVFGRQRVKAARLANEWRREPGIQVHRHIDWKSFAHLADAFQRCAHAELFGPIESASHR